MNREERYKQIDQVDELVKQGMTKAAAAKQVGILLSTYQWNKAKRKRAKNNKSKVTVQALPETTHAYTTTKLIAFVGSPEDVLSAVRSLT